MLQKHVTSLDSTSTSADTSGATSVKSTPAPLSSSARSTNQSAEASNDGFKKFGTGDDRLGKYAIDVFQPESDALKRAKDLCHARSLPKIYLNEMDGRHIQVLTKMVNARKVVEIGTLGGYSAICIASAMARQPNSDHEALPVLFTLEINAKNASVARENISHAGYNDLVKVIEGPAMESLKEIEKHGPFDLVFVDADKSSYPAYGKWAEANLRVGGVLIADNTFAWGLVLQDKIDNPDTASAAAGIKEFNTYVAQSKNFLATLLPTGEGLTVAVKVENR